MKGYNLPDNVSPNDESAPWNKEECSCPEEQPEDERLELIDPFCPIHGLTKEQLQTV